MADSKALIEDIRSSVDEPATSAFSLTVGLISWVAAEARRRKIGKSDLVREIIDEARREQAEQTEAKAA